MWYASYPCLIGQLLPLLLVTLQDLQLLLGCVHRLCIAEDADASGWCWFVNLLLHIRGAAWLDFDLWTFSWNCSIGRLAVVSGTHTGRRLIRLLRTLRVLALVVVMSEALNPCTSGLHSFDIIE